MEKTPLALASTGVAPLTLLAPESSGQLLAHVTFALTSTFIPPASLLAY